MPVCHAPKCHVVSNKCACPNAWIEFLSRNAHMSAEKKSIKKHAEEYRQARDADEAFKKRPGGQDGTCNSNTTKLCTWRFRRTRAKKHAPILHKKMLQTMRNNVAARAIAACAPVPYMPDEHAVLKEKKRDTPNHIKRAKLRDFLVFQMYKDHRVLDQPSSKDCVKYCDRIERYLDLRARGYAVIGVIAAANYANPDLPSVTVFQAVRLASTGARRNVIIKVTTIDTTRDYNSYKREVNMHNAFYAKMKRFVVEPIAQYRTKHFSRQYGIQIQERADGSIHDVVRGNLTRVTARHIATRLKELLHDLNTYRLLHGDMHSQNIAIKWFGGKPRPVLIDFGRSSQYTKAAWASVGPKNVDAFMVWASFALGWPSTDDNKKIMFDAMNHVNFPGSELFKKIYNGSERPPRANARFTVDMFQDFLKIVAP